MLKKFDMDKAKPIKTSMPTTGHLDLDGDDKAVDEKVYRSMIGSLIYLCASRPDIMLSVCMCARFQANPKECHIMAVKRFFRYLVLTPNLESKATPYYQEGYKSSWQNGDKKCSCRSLVGWRDVHRKFW
jgi:hypothetical protein